MNIKTGDKGEMIVSVNKILGLVIALIAILSPIISVTALATAYGGEVDRNTETIEDLIDHHSDQDELLTQLSTNDAVQDNRFETNSKQLDRLESKIDKLNDKMDVYISQSGGD